MKKIYVSPSSQTANTYAVGNTNEAVQCRRIAKALVTALERCGFEAKAGYEGSTMNTRVAESNAWGADLHVPVHTNAFNKQLKGTRMFCHDLTGNGYKASKAILEALKPVVPGESDGIKAAGYYEIKHSKCPCAYVEAAFHDNAEQAQWIIDHVEDIAEAICNGICNYYGVAYVGMEKPIEEDKLYYVQVGAFHNRKYAEDLAARLKADGYPSFIKHE